MNSLNPLLQVELNTMNDSVSTLQTLLKEAKEKEILSGRITFNTSMSRYTTWRIGGRAECVYQPESVEDLQGLLKLLPEDAAVTWVGLGSNLLIRDGGLNGVVIYTNGVLNNISIQCEQYNDGKLSCGEQQQTCLISAEVGLACAIFSRKAANEGVNGAEFLSGIPGTIGGALAMNAGAFGSEIWSYVKSVKMIQRCGDIVFRAADEFNIQYRHIELKDADKNKDEWFVSAEFNFNKDEQGLEQSKQEIKRLLAKRAATQPTKQANAGSVFKNPENDYAARLIESCGLKGESVNDAQISEKHANFIVNNGNAKARDVEALINKIQQTVFKRYQVKLQTEVCIIGQAE